MVHGVDDDVSCQSMATIAHGSAGRSGAQLDTQNAALAMLRMSRPKTDGKGAAQALRAHPQLPTFDGHGNLSGQPTMAVESAAMAEMRGSPELSLFQRQNTLEEGLTQLRQQIMGMARAFEELSEAVRGQLPHDRGAAEASSSPGTKRRRVPDTDMDRIKTLKYNSTPGSGAQAFGAVVGSLPGPTTQGEEWCPMAMGGAVPVSAAVSAASLQQPQSYLAASVVPMKTSEHDVSEGSMC